MNKTYRQAGFGRVTAILLCFILISILIPTCIAGYFSITAQKKHHAQLFQKDRERLLSTLAATLASPLWTVRVDQIDQIVTSFSTLPYVLEISVHDSISNKEIFSKETRTPKPSAEIFKETKDIVSHDKIIGQVAINCSSSYYDQLLRDDIEELLVLFVVLFIVTSLLVTIVIFRFLLKPLLEMIKHTLKSDLIFPDYVNKWTSPLEKIQFKIIYLLQEFEKYYRIVDQNIITLRLDRNYKLTSVSTAFSKMFDSDKDNSPTSNMRIPLPFANNEQENIFQNGLQCAEQNGEWTGETCWLSTDKSTIWLHCTISLETEHNQSGYVVVCENITDKKLIEKIAVTDKLTGLFNRVKIDEQLSAQFELFKRYNTPFSLIFIDIDHFKPVNDTYGHQAGDTILKEFSTLIQNGSRTTDTTGRYGGEEFILICPSTNIKQTSKLAEHLRQTIEKYPFTHVPQLTASLGICQVSSEDDNIQDLIERADKALYLAKTSGRNQVSSCTS